jgi:hypothetical protein
MDGKDKLCNFSIKLRNDHGKSFVWTYFGVFTNKSDRKAIDQNAFYCVPCFDEKN